MTYPIKYIEDKVSGKDFNRNGYLTLKNSLLRDGDTLVIKELDRLGRNMDMIKNEWQEIQSNGIDIVVLDTLIIKLKILHLGWSISKIVVFKNNYYNDYRNYY